MIRKEDLLKYPDLIRVLNVVGIILLVIVFGLSFLRTYYVCNSINKKIRDDKKPIIARLFFSCFTAEILVYIYFCVLSYNEFPDNLIFPITSGLNLTVWWDLDSWKSALLRFIIGVAIWFVLVLLFIILFVFRNNKITSKDKKTILLKCTLLNMPFIMVYYCFTLVFSFNMCLHTTKQMFLN